ncbi:cytochrome P450 2U1-like [Amphiura filiformis]|uniref:cytochrome P450 2U1-like n=1 Tax=Amphiura filiformis TaxID=82378 RepID=UPI003B227D37
MDIQQLLGLFILLSIVVLFIQYYKRRWPVVNFPPGPTGWPFIGTILSIRNEVFLRAIADKLKPQYGKIFSLMQDVPIVIVTGYDAINEVFQSNKGFDFASRKEPMYLLQLHNPKKLGVFLADYSESWQQQRRFALSTLRGFGFGKTSFEKKITDEVSLLLSHLKDIARVPQDLSTLLTSGVANVMCDTLLGCHYDHNDIEFQHILHVLEECFEIHGRKKSRMLDSVPISRPFLKQHAQQVIDLNEEWYAFLMSKVAEHQKAFVADTEPRDFIDCYLAKGLEEPGIFTIEDLKYVLSDLFSASTDTTSNTLKFALLYMVMNPDVQEKVHQESMRVVGTSRLPCLEDRDKMPYTAATIYEIQRLSSIAQSIPRCATVDTSLAGYSIPKGTNVVCNIWSLHLDPNLWPDPERFDPSRHLNDKGEMVKSPHVLPFGAGRRVCMGETLAKMELFLFFSSLMHQFKFDLPPGREPPSLDPVPGLTSCPFPFEVIIEEYL